MNGRLLAIGIAFGGVWVILAARVFHVQVLRSAYYRGVSESQSVTRSVLPPARGEIFDRTGARLVVNVAGEGAPRGSRLRPNGALAGQVLGMVGRDGYGQSGLEFHLDRELRGTDGWRYLRRDSRRRPAPGADDQIQPPVHGLGVRLSLDARVQSVAEHALERGVLRTQAKAGVAIVIEPRTGDILAMANYPFLDPNTRQGENNEHWLNQAVAKVYEPGSTFKVITAAALMEEGRVRPGDTVDAEGGKWQIGGQWIRDTHPMNRISFSTAMAHSSNVVFAKLSTRLQPVTFYKYLRSFGFGMKTGVPLPAEESGLLKPVGTWSGRTQQTIAFGHEISATPLQVAMAFAAIANDGVLMRPRLVHAWVDARGGVREEPPREVRRVLSAPVAAELRAMLAGVVDHGTAAAIRHPFISIAGKTGTAEKIDPVTGRYLPGRFHASFAGMAPAHDPAFVCVVVVDEPERLKYGGQAAAPIFREILDRLAERDADWTPRPEIWAAADGARDTAARIPPAGPKLAAYRLPGGAPAPAAASGKAAAERTPEVGAAEMPDLHGTNLRDALLRLRALGVEVEYAGEGRVREQSPAPGTPMRRGDRSRLTLGWGE